MIPIACPEVSYFPIKKRTFALRVLAAVSMSDLVKLALAIARFVGEPDSFWYERPRLKDTSLVWT
jgi:hypothetical protein